MNKFDPGYSPFWVKSYCSYNGLNEKSHPAVHPFISFYPYILLGLTLILFSIDKIFQTLFGAGDKLEKFHKLLANNKILGEPDKISTTHHPKASNNKQILSADGSLQEIELRVTFKKNQNFFMSFIMRSALQTALATSFLGYILGQGLKITEEDTDIYCSVHDYWHECHGIPMSNE